MKKLNAITLLILGLLPAQQSLGQLQATGYFKLSGRQVKVRDSADFVRVLSERDSATGFYNVEETYINGRPKLSGKTSNSNYLVLEGECTTFYPSGKKRRFASYLRGKPAGFVYDYYPNGNLYAIKKYISNQTVPGSNSYGDFLVQACNDSIGKALVVDGNGHFIAYDDNFEEILEEGTIAEGKKNSEWVGHSGKGKYRLNYSEKFENGKLIEGHSVDNDGVAYNYTNEEVDPQFVGGEKAFDRYLMRNIKYPPLAKLNKVGGTVLISFIIEKDGSLSNAKIMRSPDDELGNEALRVMQTSPKWKPGIQFGRPVRVSYTVPITFNAGKNND